MPKDFKNVPFISTSIEEAVKLTVLNEEGYNVIKRILWIIHLQFPEVKYNPMLPNIIAFLGIIFKESEIYSIVKTLMESSIEILSNVETAK